MKGKISRILANKCAMASRLDNFLVQPNNKFGEMFKKQIDERIEEPENVELGKRNIEIMESLVNEMQENGEYLDAKDAENLNVD